MSTATDKTGTKIRKRKEFYKEAVDYLNYQIALSGTRMMPGQFDQLVKHIQRVSEALWVDSGGKIEP